MNWRRTTLVIGMVIVVAANLFVAERALPFFKGNRDFTITRIIERKQWIESAPVVLANHFDKVTVLNVGDRFKNGFGFESELVAIYGIDSVDYANDPIDLQDFFTTVKLNRGKLFVYESQVHCSGRKSKYCDMQLIWDKKAMNNYRTFVGVQTGENAYALVDTLVLDKWFGTDGWRK
jgi:hypothetical protein